MGGAVTRSSKQRIKKRAPNSGWSGTRNEAQPLRTAVFYHPPRWGLARVSGLLRGVSGVSRVGGTEGLAKPALNTTIPDSAAIILTNRILPLSYCVPLNASLAAVSNRPEKTPRAVLKTDTHGTFVYLSNLPKVDFRIQVQGIKAGGIPLPLSSSDTRLVALF